MPREIRRLLPRCYRLGVVIMVALLMHHQHQWLRAQRDTALTVEQARAFFPSAATLGPRTPPHNIQTVQDGSGRQIGLVLHTSPEADFIRGYSGPNDILVALDPTGTVTGVALLSSEDTADHVRDVIESTSFWRSFHGLTLGNPGRPEVDTVSGSTLTSDAIISAITHRLGGTAQGSSLFPTEILLAEVQLLMPTATALAPHPRWFGVQIVRNEKGATIAHALRTSPSQDNLLGYQGPADTLILLDENAATIKGLRLRKSYDNDDYIDRVLEEDSYLRMFDGWPVEKLADLDLAEAGIEGVSGATHTSWALTESVRRRVLGFVTERDAPPNSFPVTPRQLGLILLTVGGLAMSFTKLRGKPALRLLWQVVLIFYLGFYTGDLVSQALLAGWAQHGVDWVALSGICFLTAAAFLIPWTTGHQLYCHQLCPHGALQQWMQKIPVPNLKVPARLHRILSTVPFLLLVAVVGNVMLGLGWNNAALEAFDAYLFLVAGWASISIAVIGLIASAFVPLAYCKYGCPTGLLFKFLRNRGAGERFDHRDLAAGALLAAAGLVYLL